MTPEQILLIAIIVIPLALVLLNRLRPDVAALLMATLLAVAQFAGLGMLAQRGTPDAAARAMSGFGQPIIMTLIALFVITRALEKSGVTRWVTRALLRMGGQSETRLIALFAATTAVFSLFMNNLAAGALLLPSAIEASRRTGIKPSKLLIPVAYGSLLGGAATYFTTANIIVSGLLPIANPPQAPLSILSFTPTGGLIAIAGILFLALAGKRLLPDREPPAGHFASRPTARDLEDLYQLGDRLWQACLKPDSTLVGGSLAQAGLGERLGLAVSAVQRGERVTVSPPSTLTLLSGDQLTVIGREERVRQMSEMGFDITRLDPSTHLSDQGIAVVEVMPAPRSTALGQTLKQIGFRARYGLTAVALFRKNRSYRTSVADFPLVFGDTLLAIGTAPRLADLRASPDFILLEPGSGSQPVRRRDALFALAVIFAAVAASVLGAPVFLSVLAGALIIILSRLVTMEEAFKAIEWQAVFLIAGMYAVSLAMVQTGLAELIGRWVVQAARPFGGLGLAAGAFLLTAMLTQVMGGQVTALVTGPIAISAAISLGVNPQAVAVATAIGCSASFLTMLAHPVNVIMLNPGNYRFSDFFRIGWMLTIVCFVMLLLGMKLFWGL